ncbi:hypothetical protein UCDDS831_g07469 [Diplodia seriata]|uniref:Uncharacterized protein n=1 Tax=Diplodia seriata TaxID=420778 RepID=A0A0G2E0I6_9PEZI|nr:hypothetical protein UCDDS831_g07469 [Diplodia seriata]
MPGMAAALNNYFVPGYGISRSVIQGEIRYHCGPDAIAQIEDIKEASREYEERQAERSGDDTEPFVNRPIPVKTGGRRSS